MSLNFIQETTEFRSLLDAVEQGALGINISGIIPAAKPYFLAQFLQSTPKKIVLIRSSETSLNRISEKVRFFLAQSGSSLEVFTLPPLMENPYVEMPPSLAAVSARMRFFHDLPSKRPALVVTSLMGLLKPFPHPRDLPDLFLDVSVGDRLRRDNLLDTLLEFGYSREDVINSHGEFAHRGGIVDVFSPWQDQPLRIELSGDNISSLREFDLSSQRSVRRLQQIMIPSLREYPGSKTFLHEWRAAAEMKDGGRFLSDVRRQAERHLSGDPPSSFAFQALLMSERFAPFSEYLPDALFVFDGGDRIWRNWEENLRDLQQSFQALDEDQRFALPPEEIFPEDLRGRIEKGAVNLEELPTEMIDAHFHFPFQSTPKFENKIPFFLDYLKKTQREGGQTFIFISGEGVRRRLGGLLSQYGVAYRESDSPMDPPRDESVTLLVGRLDSGFGYPIRRLTYFAETDIFTAERVLTSRPRIKPFVSDFQDLKAGDYIVHTDYGIGIFSGLVKMRVDSKGQEFIQLIYRDDDKLFVPVEDLNLVQKYTRTGPVMPALHKLGSPNWERTKARTRKAIEAMAKELLDLYARRKAVAGFRFSGQGTWEADFEKTFEYAETDDQLRAIKEIIEDMESDSPMDRLLCGDVGYGKTEVAMRAAFKAVMDGKQVAVLCPTTILANQHLKTFRERMVLFPVHVEGLTRFQTRARQQKILAELSKGVVDIIIGTHRLLSQDVRFNDVGLLIVDEEQRFGVGHKEKIKQMRTDIDVLTMTATPIPRTLNLSLAGLRDISLIETPPRDRLAVHTVVTPFSRNLVETAIKKELSRGGQVYFVHNQVEDIESMAEMLRKWVPQARISIAHGQMPGSKLEKQMLDFIQRKTDVLVSTTIIENGIDISLVNTLIVNRADRFGLAQLYQLRGRVGRSSRQAAAYFLVPSFADLTPLANERLKALREFSELGAGFRLAAKDLEIRGSGSFLGSSQHGYMEAVGFDYYMHLLESTVRELKGDPPTEHKTKLNLKVDIRIPETYLPQVNLRLNLYKRISSLRSLEEGEHIKEEIQDRYGMPPPSVGNLLGYGTIKFLAQRLRIKSIDRIGSKLVFEFFPSSSADLTRLTGLIGEYSGSITPQGVMSLFLSGQGEAQILDETIIILKELSLI